MVDVNESVNTRLSLLELEMTRTQQTLIKMDHNADKHREEHSKITDKIYGRMETMQSEVKSDIKELHDVFSEELKNHREEIDRKIIEQNDLLKKINDRLDGLDKWRWMIVGASAVVGYLLSKLSTLFGVTINAP